MELWTVEEAARYLKMHPETIRRKVRENAIPFVRLGRWIRFRKESLDEWIALGCPKRERERSLFEHPGPQQGG